MPEGAVTGACHVSPIVNDLDRAARFYHDLIGLDLVPAPPAGALPWDEDPGHLNLHGLPQARLRFIGARMPGIRCGVELVEINNVERTPVRRRMQDPGAVTLILLVRDLDAAFVKLKAAGVPVISTGGAPLAMSATSKTRAVIVQDPDGHFVELAQLDPLPPTTAPAGSNVIGIRLRVTVGDMDGTLRFYQQRLGLKGELRAFTSSLQVSAMLGLRDVEYPDGDGTHAELAAAARVHGGEGRAGYRRAIARPGSGLVPAAAQRPGHRCRPGRHDRVRQHGRVEQPCPGVDDIRVPPVAPRRRAGSE